MGKKKYNNDNNYIMYILIFIITVVIIIAIVYIIFFNEGITVNSFMKVEPDNEEKQVLSSINNTLNDILSKSEYKESKPNLDFTVNITTNPSYVINKEHIFMCLRNPTNKDMYDKNTINYVAIHELAHIIDHDSNGSKTDEHGESFQKIFDSLIKTAIQHNYYDPRKSIASAYCKV